jgi:hypothetical protein
MYDRLHERFTRLADEVESAMKSLKTVQLLWCVQSGPTPYRVLQDLPGVV